MKNAIRAILLWLLAGAAHGAAVKIATVAPEGSLWMRAMRSGAAEIKQQTDGRVTFKYYSGGVMGNDKTVLRKIRIGQLHGGVFTSTGLADRYPDIMLYGLPLLFTSLGEVDYVRERFDARLLAGLRGVGFESFGFAEGGFAFLMSNQPVRSLADVRGKKMWVPEGDLMSYVATQALGLSPVTLPLTDVLTGLQTDLINVIASSPVGALVMQWHTKVKYVTELPISYIFGFMVIDNRVLKRMAEQDLEIVRTVMRQTYAQMDSNNRTDNSKAAEAFGRAGLEFIRPSALQVNEWRDSVIDANRELAASGAFDEQLMNEVLASLEEFKRGIGTADTSGGDTVH